MAPLGLVLILGLIAALANLAGGLLLLKKGVQRYLHGFVAFGSGFLIAVAIVEMLPESFHLAPFAAPFLILAGFCSVHILEHTLVSHFHVGEETHTHEFVHAGKAYSLTFGLTAHTFFDGIAIASGFAFSGKLGWLIFAGVLLHKLPVGFTVASVMLASGQGKRVAVFSAALLGVSTLAGVVAIRIFPTLAHYGLPVSAGVALYVAATDLLPEVNRERGLHYRLLFLFGVAVMIVLGQLQ
ncbi:MAG TPA: ZIP family metal transporter [Acidobacteriaceae bacterium]|jgi:ZIP family zinc transporter/zinc and cadmium transporter|nr:ZIP family metal transporter [Acidobacteriaceae bacterium]